MKTFSVTRSCNVECNSVTDKLLRRKFVCLKLSFEYKNQLILQEKQQRFLLVLGDILNLSGHLKFSDFLCTYSKISCGIPKEVGQKFI
jgi:hypothetical protein